MSFFEDIVDRAGRLLGIVTTTGGATIGTETTLSALNTKVTTGTGAVAAGLRVAQSVVIDAGNTNMSTLGAGLTWTGTWVDTLGYSQIVTNFKSSQSGSFYIDFSADGVSVDRALGPYSMAADTDTPQLLAPVRRYYRAKYLNGSGSTANLRIETRLLDTPGNFQTRVTDAISATSSAQLNKSVLVGMKDNTLTYANVGVSTSGDALLVEQTGPLAAFGEMVTADLEPRIQLDAVYGLQATDTESITDGVSGTVTSADSMFTMQTGTTVGGYGVLRSRRMIRYRPGQGVRLRFTALYSAGVANSLQFAGGFTSTEALGFAYSGTTFGILRRIAGAAAIHRLTVTVGSGGAETVTVTLNGVAFTVASGGVLSTTGLAERIAEVGVFTGWSSVTSPTSNGATVTFVQNVPAATPGAFTMSSTGTARGTFTTVLAGAPNDDVTGFIPQTSWNVDKMDGSANASNPSGALMDKTKFNVFEVVFPYLGAGTMQFKVMTSPGKFNLVHRLEYPNNYTIPSMKNPTLRLGWIAASLGSTTNVTVKGICAAGFVEGESFQTRDPFGTSLNNFTAGTGELVALAVRVGSTYNGLVNQREVKLANVVVGTETTARITRVRCILNPTMTGTVNWSYVDSTRTGVEVATPTAITPTFGSNIAFTVSPSGTAAILNLSDLDVRLEPGDVFAIALTTASSTAVCSLSLNWNES